MSARSRKLIPIVMAVSLGAFVAVASDALDWSSTTIFVVGSALAAVLALLGTPLLLLDLDQLQAPSGDVGTFAEDWQAAFRDQIAEELAVQARELATQWRAFDEPTGKSQNFHAPLFRAAMQHKLRALNQASELELPEEIAERHHQVEYLKFRREQPPAYPERLSFLLELGGVGVHRTRHDLEPLDVKDFGALRKVPQQARLHRDPRDLQPTLVAVTR